LYNKTIKTVVNSNPKTSRTWTACIELSS
jgi:hypothetical protein